MNLRNTLVLLLTLIPLNLCCSPVQHISANKAEVKPQIGYMVFDDSVNPMSALMFQLELADLDSKSDIIVIRINTNGGIVASGLQMMDAIESSRHPVVCVVDRGAYSMGAFILQACDKRIMTKRSLQMIHKIRFSPEYKPTPEDIHTLEVEWGALTEEITLKTKVSADWLNEKTSHGDWYFGWQEALDLGFVDCVVPTMKTVLDNPMCE